MAIVAIEGANEAVSGVVNGILSELNELASARSKGQTGRKSTRLGHVSEEAACLDGKSGVQAIYWSHWRWNGWNDSRAIQGTGPCG